MKSPKSLLYALFSLAMFLGAAATPAVAQFRVIAAGGGSFVGNNQQTRLFAFWVVESNGVVQGEWWGYEPGTNALLAMDITSFMFLGDTLAVAGPITRTSNAPPEYVVGGTAFLAVQDNGGGRHSGDAHTGTSPVPPQFGNPTIQQIIGLIGSGPPPQAFLPLIFGGIDIR